MTTSFDRSILFYDILCDVPEKTLSPFTTATRWSLIIKGLPFERKLVELADVTTLSEHIGFKKIRWFTGDLKSTFPAIHDPNTGAKVTDSFEIAEYLDRTYGDGRPLLVPPGTRTLQKAFLSMLLSGTPLLFPFFLQSMLPHVTEYSRQYFVETREALAGKKIENVRPKGEEGIKAWSSVKKVFNTYNSWFGDDFSGPYLTGATPILADIYLASRLYFLRAAFGRDSQEWRDISSWHDGRWGKFLDTLLKDYPLD